MHNSEKSSTFALAANWIRRLSSWRLVASTYVTGVALPVDGGYTCV